MWYSKKTHLCISNIFNCTKSICVRKIVKMNISKCQHFFKPIDTFISVSNRFFRTTPKLDQLRKLTRCRVVDNSNLGKQAMLDGKPPKVIHVYNKTGVGTIGDRILVAVKGLKKKAYIVGVKKHQANMIPKFDSNNIVLLDDHGNPLGTRVLVPIPSLLRGRKEFSKIIAISTRFV